MSLPYVTNKIFKTQRTKVRKKMQRLLFLKQASSSFSKALTKTSSLSSLLHSFPYKTFSSIAKPTVDNQFLNSSFSHPFHHHSFPWRSQLSLTGEIRGFLSYPVVAKRFWLNFSSIHLKTSGKSLLGCRVWFLRPQIPRGRFDFGLQTSRW